MTTPVKWGYDIGMFLSRLLEAASGGRTVVAYSGRFQPFHKAHFQAYLHLVEKFGKENVFITTSDKQDTDRHPFSFDEKKEIMMKMFNIPTENIIQVKNPYVPRELTAQLAPEDALVMAVGEKDSGRLKTGKYFEPYDSDAPMNTLRDNAYVLNIPHQELEINGTRITGTGVRGVFASDNNGAKKSLFQKMYDGANDDIFDMMVTKISKAAGKIIPSYGPSPSTPKRLDSPQPQTDTEKILQQKIKNPDTGNTILVKTALSYEKNRTVNRQARQLVKKQMGESVLLEGGAAGHIAHPYDDMELSFRDLKELTLRSLMGGLDKEGPVSEKTDGMNIQFSVRDGKVVFARGKAHLKNSGENAMSLDDLSHFEKWADRPALQQAFADAGEDLHKAISSMSPEEIQKTFGNGSNFMNAEIINPDAKIRIQYGKKILIFHNLIEYDASGTPTKHHARAGEEFVERLQKVNAATQKTYGLRGPNFVVFSDKETDGYKKKAKEYLEKLDSIAASVGLDESATIGDFFSKKIRSLVESNGIPATEEEIQGMVRRWVYKDKSFGTKHIKKNTSRPTDVNEAFAMWFRQVDGRLPLVTNTLLKPIITTVLQLGADTTQRISNTLAANNPLAGEEFKNEIKRAIEYVRNTPEDTEEKQYVKLKRLEQQLDYLDSVGYEKLVSSEGLVFNFGDKIYKLTGAFAPFNRIVGMVRKSDDDTDMASGAPKKPSPQDAKPTEVPSKDTPEEPNVKQKKIGGSSLDKKIINPVTKRNIKVRSALTYPDDQPVKKLAQRLVDKK